MKILITGSSGFVGKNLVSSLSKKHQVIGLDLIRGQNIFDSKILSAKMKGVDVVIHLAAYISAIDSWNKPYEYMMNNSLGTLNVTKTAIDANVKKLILFSSAAVKARPLTPYAVSKRSAEDIVKLYSDKINVIIVRPENIYGLGQKESYGYVIHNFINCVRSKENIKIFGAGNQGRDFIYIDDVVKTVKKLLSCKIKSGSVLSLGTGKSVKIKDLAALIMKITNIKVNIEHLPKRIEPYISVSDPRMLNRVGIDHKKFTKLEKGIKKLL